MQCCKGRHCLPLLEQMWCSTGSSVFAVTVPSPPSPAAHCPFRCVLLSPLKEQCPQLSTSQPWHGSWAVLLYAAHSGLSVSLHLHIPFLAALPQDASCLVWQHIYFWFYLVLFHCIFCLYPLWSQVALMSLILLSADTVYIVVISQAWICPLVVCAVSFSCGPAVKSDLLVICNPGVLYWLCGLKFYSRPLVKTLGIFLLGVGVGEQGVLYVLSFSVLANLPSSFLPSHPLSCACLM